MHNGNSRRVLLVAALSGVCRRGRQFQITVRDFVHRVVLGDTDESVSPVEAGQMCLSGNAYRTVRFTTPAFQYRPPNQLVAQSFASMGPRGQDSADRWYRKSLCGPKDPAGRNQPRGIGSDQMPSNKIVTINIRVEALLLQNEDRLPQLQQVVDASPAEITEIRPCPSDVRRMIDGAWAEFRLLHNSHITLKESRDQAFAGKRAGRGTFSRPVRIPGCL